MEQRAKQRDREEISRLRGPEKVAALLLSMDKTYSDRLLKHFDAKQIRLISRSISTLGPVPQHLVPPLVEAFESEVAMGANLSGSAKEAERLLTGVLPPREVTDIMSEILGQSNLNIWDSVAKVPEAALAQYLSSEHPQTGAYILSHLTTTTAAAALRLLSPEIRREVSYRMLDLQPVSDAATRVIEAGLKESLLLKSTGNSPEATQSRFAEIMNKMEVDQMELILENLASTRPEVALAVRAKLFTFEDLVKLSNKARMALFEKVPVETTIIALKNTSGEFREVVFSAIAARARRMVEQELASGQSSPQKEIATARRTIAETVLAMAGRGELVIHEEPAPE